MNDLVDQGFAFARESWPTVRRLVTGVDREGRSCVLFDGQIGALRQSPEGSAINIWQTDSLPADNRGSEDCGKCDFDLGQLEGPGSAFILVHYPPGFAKAGARMHDTDTVDYLIVLNGEITLVLETGDVRLRAGDTCVDRGVFHGWRNDTDSMAMAAVVTVPALKLPKDGIGGVAVSGPEPVTPVDALHWPQVRRVVTGLDCEGRSSVILDGLVPPPRGGTAVNIWYTPTIPADNAGAADQGSNDFNYEQLKSGGSSFFLVQHPPGFGADDPHMHQVDSLSMMIMLEGSGNLVLEAGEFTVHAGDILIERGVNHGWRNPSGQRALAAVVVLPALSR